MSETSSPPLPPRLLSNHIYHSFDESNGSGSNLEAERDLDCCLEETYTSSLFQTEPLYQFYDRGLRHLEVRAFFFFFFFFFFWLVQKLR